MSILLSYHAAHGAAVVAVHAVVWHDIARNEVQAIGVVGKPKRSLPVADLGTNVVEARLIAAARNWQENELAGINKPSCEAYPRRSR